ncbi:MAG: DUF692 domain-containing protein [Candidatus Competibacteraceae bacterium]
MPTEPSSVGPGTIPAQAGVGLRAPHYRDFLEERPAIGWLEVHPENYFVNGGKPLYFLERIRSHYPLSLHGVGLSIGSTDPLDIDHLNRLKELIKRFEPALVSEHVSWGSVDGRFHNDLLPLPYTEEALEHMVGRVAQVQDHLGRQILLENISSYLEYEISSIPEWEFITTLARRTGCGLLLDVNNIYVNACNHGFNPDIFLNAIPGDLVQEIHLAGFTLNTFDDGRILIDTHSRPVCEEVWALYRRTIRRFGPIPSLIEWDSELPPLSILLAEARRADSILQEACYARIA